MKRTIGILMLGALSALLPLAAHAAPAARTGRATLHVASALKTHAGFMHIMGSAKLTYAMHDVTVKVTVDGLPAASKLGGKTYVVFASDGGMTDRVGPLKMTGAMAGVTATVMMTKVQDLYVYAVKSSTATHPTGTLVLSGMVG